MVAPERETSPESSGHTRFPRTCLSPGERAICSREGRLSTPLTSRAGLVCGTGVARAWWCTVERVPRGAERSRQVLKIQKRCHHHHCYCTTERQYIFCTPEPPTAKRRPSYLTEGGKTAARSVSPLAPHQNLVPFYNQSNQPEEVVTQRQTLNLSLLPLPFGVCACSSRSPFREFREENWRQKVTISANGDLHDWEGGDANCCSRNTIQGVEYARAQHLSYRPGLSGRSRCCL